MDSTRAIEVNRANWQDRAVAHGQDTSGFYGIVAFKEGRDTLTPIEDGEIGDVTGLRVLHLQCHIGLDTLSLARRGAKVTGVDFSSNAVAFATNLAREIDVSATFIESDVYNVRKAVPGEFDLVYATWGVLCWIPDAREWMRAAASMLAPGGRLYLADGHPLVEEAQEVQLADGSIRIVAQSGWHEQPIETLGGDEPYSYTGDFIEHAANHQFVHSFSEIITGAADAGLRIMFLHEHDSPMNWQRFEIMERNADGLYAFPKEWPNIPLVILANGNKRQMTKLVTNEPLARFLESSALIEVDDAGIREFAGSRLVGLNAVEATRAVFHFVRDEVSHSWDIQSHRVTRSATDVLTHREGICYAKSHLFAALLRRVGVPTGICYQRLTLFDDASGGYAVHALNTVYLESLNRWIRLDARGNKPGVKAQFSLDDEILAFPIRKEFDEIDYGINLSAPHPTIVQTLQENTDAIVMYRNALPQKLAFETLPHTAEEW